MSGTQRTQEQFQRYTFEQFAIAQQHGLQPHTPEHVARLACVNPQQLLLNPGTSPSRRSRGSSRGSRRKSGSTSGRRGGVHRSLGYIATRESLIAEESQAPRAPLELRPPPLPCRPAGCAPVPQTLLPDSSSSIIFSNHGIEGVPQMAHENMDGIDGCNDPITLNNGAKRVTFVIAWPGYNLYEFSLDLRKQDETTNLSIKRPICRSELATDILFVFTRWFYARVMQLDGPEPDHEVPVGWKIQGGWPDVMLGSIWLTKFGPVQDGDGTRWVAEFLCERGD